MLDLVERVKQESTHESLKIGVSFGDVPAASSAPARSGPSARRAEYC
jgi:hypothetical protein